MSANILIIDDEEGLSELIKEFIESEMPNVHCNCIINWSDFPQNHSNVDLILSDINGVGTPVETTIKVITFSGDSSLNPDIIKPFEIEDLIVLIVKKLTT